MRIYRRQVKLIVTYDVYRVWKQDEGYVGKGLRP
jgi:hypothetical protein